MANVPLADAFDIQEGLIWMTRDGSPELTPEGFITELTINNRRPEEFVNVIGGKVRRSQPEEIDWTVGGVVLYNNVRGIKDLMGAKFSITMSMVNPIDLTGQTIRLIGCKIAENSLNFNDASTLSLSGRAEDWQVEDLQ